jgi:hypothetical protein
MDYITRLYRSKAEQLQEQVNFLEAQLQHLAEFRGDDVNFSGTGQGQPTVSDEQLKDQMHKHKRTGFFNSEIADDKQSQEYRDAKAELERRSKPTKPDTQSQIIIRTPPMFPQAKAPAAPAAPAKAPAKAPAAPAKAQPKENKSGSVADTGADAGGYGPPSSMYDPNVKDAPIAPPANASPRVQATDANGNPSNTPEARGNLQKPAMNPSDAHTPTATTTARRTRENAQRQGVYNDGVDHGGARSPETTIPQKEDERAFSQPTKGYNTLTGETLPQAEKRIAAYKKSGMGDLQQAWKNARTPTYSPAPKSTDAAAASQEDQAANNAKAGQFVNNLLYNRKFKGEQDARTPAQDPDMATGAYSTRNYGNGTPDAQRGQHSMDPETWMGKGTDEDPMRYVPKQVSGSILC